MNDHNFTVCAFNRTTDKVDSFLANEAKGTKVIGAQSLEGMVRTLKKPRRVMMLVKGMQIMYKFSNIKLVLKAVKNITNSLGIGEVTITPIFC